jgi:hypothetical protein
MAAFASFGCPIDLAFCEEAPVSSMTDPSWCFSRSSERSGSNKRVSEPISGLIEDGLQTGIGERAMKSWIGRHAIAHTVEQCDAVSWSVIRSRIMNPVELRITLVDRPGPLS